MARHSKHNTASGHFTYAEYQMLKDRWGSRKLRLTVESMRAFYACCLCLQDAQRPVCCAQGHVFCKECILSDLVTQKTQLAEHSKRRAELAQRQSEQEAEAASRAEKRRIAAFEEASNALPHEAAKRKRDDDPADDASKHARTDATTQGAANPAFWLPNMAPEVEADALQELAKDDRPSTTLCIAGSEKPHKLTMKGLVPVHFGTRTVDTQTQHYCPSCKKELPLTAQVHVMRKCGHVLCASCTKELVHVPLARHDEGVACPECSERVRKREDVIAIVREGTGFASGGRSETEAKGITFQG
ncbi:hypothetical protein MBRA1_002665 [Malassezia brasiliensis]|uniref:RING-type domain-containing protein n=1 Tax=Malassezia brasiliensis TaxID=1821822 RepID=A0AAF0DXW8_9BASI|nr:hypothetical protein MBRA1_002665 [Malassezia brasiliensis]